MLDSLRPAWEEIESKIYLDGAGLGLGDDLLHVHLNGHEDGAGHHLGGGHLDGFGHLHSDLLVLHHGLGHLFELQAKHAMLAIESQPGYWHKDSVIRGSPFGDHAH